MKKFTSFVFGLFAGVAVCGGLALLFTPVKGSAVRARLSNSFNSIQNEVKTAAKERMDELNNELARLQNKPVE